MERKPTKQAIFSPSISSRALGLFLWQQDPFTVKTNAHLKVPRKILSPQLSDTSKPVERFFYNVLPLGGLDHLVNFKHCSQFRLP